jgi:C-terminal processing protease CtpA/Prc
VIVAVDGQSISSFAEATAAIRRSPDEPIAIVIERDGAQRTVTLTPVAIQQPVIDETGRPVVGADGEVQTQEVGLAGIRQEVE